MDNVENRISKEELHSLGRALRECKWVRNDDGAFYGEANGWRISFGTEDGKQVGVAFHDESNVQVNIPSWIVEKVVDRLMSLN